MPYLPAPAPASRPCPWVLISALLWVSCLLALLVTELMLSARLDAPEALDAWVVAAGAGLVAWLLGLIRHL